MAVSAEKTTETDPAGDVWHWWMTETSWGWDYDIKDKSDIDIREMTFEIVGDQAIFTFKVEGNIVTNEKVNYYGTYDSDDVTYYFNYLNGTGMCYADGPSGMSFSQANYSISGSTLTATFTSVGEGSSNVQISGYAHYYSDTVLAEGGEYWMDATEDTGGDGDGDGDGDGGNGGPSGSSGTPGFEAVAVLAAVGIALIILRRRK